MIYCKAGRVTWHQDRIEVMLEPHRYPQQRAMEATCAQFNAINPRWCDAAPYISPVPRQSSSNYAVVNVLVKPDVK